MYPLHPMMGRSTAMADGEKRRRSAPTRTWRSCGKGRWGCAARRTVGWLRCRIAIPIVAKFVRHTATCLDRVGASNDSSGASTRRASQCKTRPDGSVRLHAHACGRVRADGIAVCSGDRCARRASNLQWSPAGQPGLATTIPAITPGLCHMQLAGLLNCRHRTVCRTTPTSDRCQQRPNSNLRAKALYVAKLPTE